MTSEKIQRVWTPEERLTLAPHIERVVEADRRRTEALHSLNIAARVVEPRMISDGWAFDAEAGVWTTQEATNG